ncbi:MarR family winged helix-turn-helix transcriptional regulator [Protaetiibacter intestinalis]|uniref:MarR family winged helix-turn-helix transcriptional regulator n=1 Tax=Protaetiibacter intestinalis TaxID=2419774 RepID=UPI001D03EB16|nr:MarR family transcriptional regulator [Protaetiibacter intestinalis]
MSQPAAQDSVGYALKRAQAALHTAMDAALRDLGIGVPQYSCLTALAAQPEITNAELARAVFVTRQATHQLLAGLRDAGLVETTGSGRASRLSLSASGRRMLATSAERVAQVERTMLAGLTAERAAALRDELAQCAEALEA